MSIIVTAEVCLQRTNWTELNSCSEHVYFNGSVDSAPTDRAPTVLVSLQPIMSWRERDQWRSSCVTGSTCCRPVQFHVLSTSSYLTNVGGVQREMIRKIEQGIVRIEPDIQSANGVAKTAANYRNTTSRVGCSHFVICYTWTSFSGSYLNNAS